MHTTASDVARTSPPTVPVRRGLGHEVRICLELWRYEVMRLLRNRMQLVIMLATPVAFLVVIGSGVSGIASSGGMSNAYLAYLFPGILVLAVQGTAVNGGMGIVQDRQAGVLRGMLVAPVRRSTLLIGRCLGGATGSAVQGGLLLTMAGFVGISYDFGLFVMMFLVLTLISVCMTAVSTLGAVYFQRVTTFQSLTAVLLIPLYMLSGAMFPISSLPGWLLPVVLLNPLTYALDALRQVAAMGVQGSVQMVPLGVTIGDWVPPVGLEILAMCLLAALTIIAAARRFSRPE